MIVNLGKFPFNIKGTHIASNDYERLDLVQDNVTKIWYLSLWDVPENIELTNQAYWIVFFNASFSEQQIADNAQQIQSILTSIGELQDSDNTLADEIATLNTALSGKAAAAHTHSDYQIVYGSNANGKYTRFPKVGDKGLVIQRGVSTTGSDGIKDIDTPVTMYADYEIALTPRHDTIPVTLNWTAGINQSGSHFRVLATRTDTNEPIETGFSWVCIGEW